MEYSTTVLGLFDRVIGHSGCKSQLQTLVNKDSLPHALLFSGPSGVGKKQLAFALAGKLLNWDSEQSDAHPDLHLVEKEEERKEISVESIRKLRSDLQLKPYYGTASIAIIDNAHLMSIAASNSLLMTLEEAPAGKYIILVTDAMQRLPETIISRCQVFHFGYLQKEQCREILQTLTKDTAAEQLIDELSELTDNSLASLHLDRFLSATTSEISDQKKFVAHLSDLLARSKQISKQIRLFFESLNSSPKDLEGYAVRLGSELAADKELAPLVWQIVRKETSLQLRRNKEMVARSKFWANNLEKTLECEQMTLARSLNPQLQISSLFLRYIDHRD